MTAQEMVPVLKACARTSASYVIPADFQYLRKSGRINNLTSRIGGALHLLPVLTQSEDRRRISLMTVRRTWKAAVGTIVSSLKDTGVDERCLLSVAYAETKDLAAKVRRQIAESFPNVETELLQLSPSLITHGGPGCVVVQMVRNLR